MVTCEKEFILKLTVAESLFACVKAASAGGWRINSQKSNAISCTKRVKTSFLLPGSVEVQLKITELTAAFSKIFIYASNDILGAVNSAQIKENMESLVDDITKESQQPSTAATQDSGTAAKQFLPSRHVVINSVQLSDEQVNSLEQMFRIPIQDGTYWYDRFSGAWGVQGAAVTGFIQAGLNLGGPLRPDASNGNTGVFINGRQLHMLDVLGLQQFCPVYPGRYWVDAQGNFGCEGGPPLANLWAMSRQAGSGSSSGGAWTAKSSSGTVGGDGQGFVFFDGKNGTSWSN